MADAERREIGPVVGVCALRRWREVSGCEVVLNGPHEARTAPKPSSGSIAASAWPPAPFPAIGLTWESSMAVSISSSSVGIGRGSRA